MDFLGKAAGDVAVELSAHLCQFLGDEDEELLLIFAIRANGSSCTSGQQRSISDHYTFL